MALAATLALPVTVADASGPVRTVVTFDPAAGEFPEGIAFDKAGNMYVSVVPANEIRKIAPDGTQSVFADFGADGFGPVGLAVTPDGTVYAAEPANSLEDPTQSDPAKRGVYRIGRDGRPVRLPGTEGMWVPNDVRVDHDGTVYATDSLDGTVWRSPRGGQAQLWADDPLLVGIGGINAPIPLGANGIGIVPGAVIVANTDQGTLVRIPIQPDGSAGTPTILAKSELLIGADGLAFDLLGSIYVVSGQSRVLRLDPDGRLTTIATATDGLNQPATAAFGAGPLDHRTLYITNFSIYAPSPTPGVLTLSTPVPGRPW